MARLSTTGTSGGDSSKGSVRTTDSNRLLYWAAGLSIFALFAHAIDAPDHLKEWWGYGTIFIILAAFQFFYGIALFLQPWRYDEDGNWRADAGRSGRPYYVLGIILAAAVIILYIITRTSGMPFFGPDAAAESVTPLSLVPALEDIPLIYCLAALFLRSRAGSSGRLDAAHPEALPMTDYSSKDAGTLN